MSKKRLKQNVPVKVEYCVISVMALIRNLATGECALFLALYHYDLEVANPLGSKRGVHKHTVI